MLDSEWLCPAHSPLRPDNLAMLWTVAVNYTALAKVYYFRVSSLARTLWSMMP